MAKYFKDPFAVDGDRASVPNDAPLDGSVSYDVGFGIDYELDPGTDPDALNIPRDQFNQIMYDITQALQVLQQQGFPDFISSADNGGVPYSYSSNATCRYSGVNYYSLVNSNTDTPPSSKWGVVSYSIQSFLPGDTVETYDSSLPSGWLWLDGKTIGSAASGATARANADTSNLFTALWNSIPNSVLPIQDSAGAASTRGISAAADFASNKRLPLPDRRGRVAAAADNLGGTAAGRLNNASNGGVNGTILGNFGGEQNVALIEANNGSHLHGNGTLVASTGGEHKHDFLVNTAPPITNTPEYVRPAFQSSVYQTVYPNAVDTGQSAHSHSIGGSMASSGSGEPHDNVQPTIIAYFRIKL